MRVWLWVVAVGCGGVGDVEGFGAARRGFLVPCLSEEGAPSALAIVERRGRCVQGVGDLLPPLSEAQCYDFAAFIPPDAACRTDVSADDWELLWFTLDDVVDVADFTGSTSEILYVTPCNRGDPDSVEAVGADAEVVVVSDADGLATVDIVSAHGTGALELEVCRP